ncbi:hypothetical protein Salat_2838600 [Sesamum alatum]|uniref:Uncharacterized protein n=1 Tax=Sesamum alatum TaxID=300844 RepID=A0AAE1XMU2_9LAMI|nr:hypothetical protein Salat_2838600 [Sesamum alatum]
MAPGRINPSTQQHMTEDGPETEGSGGRAGPSAAQLQAAYVSQKETGCIQNVTESDQMLAWQVLQNIRPTGYQFLSSLPEQVPVGQVGVGGDGQELLPVLQPRNESSGLFLQQGINVWCRIQNNVANTRRQLSREKSQKEDKDW